jgi:hypothetical protein
VVGGQLRTGSADDDATVGEPDEALTLFREALSLLREEGIAAARRWR